MKMRILTLSLVLGVAIVLALGVSVGSTVAFVSATLAGPLRALGNAPAAPPSRPAPQAITTAKREPVQRLANGGEPAASGPEQPDLQDDLLPGESHAQRAQRVAQARDPDLAALLQDPDPKVANAMREFFEDDDHP